MDFFPGVDGLVWLLLAVVLLLLLQRWLHHEIQAIFLVTTRRPGLAAGLFSLVFFPGVILHELSHFLLARTLGVRTSGFSLLPRSTPDGQLQLGYVETDQADILRDALIGLAPLITGGLFVAYAAIYRLQLLPLWNFLQHGQMDLFWLGLAQLPGMRDFPLWFYLTFAVSSTMLPSASDRHAWLPLGLWLGLLVGLALLAGAGPWMLTNLAPALNAFLRSMATLFGLSAALHALLIPPTLLIYQLLSRLIGVEVA
jgi:hypothetical protein